MTGRTEIALVHLVRHANGFDAFDAFMTSYERHRPGVEHQLVLLLKGFPAPRQSAPYVERAAAAAPVTLHVDDSGLDLAAYLSAAARLSQRLLCFANSFSEVRMPDWLELLRVALDDAGVGAAGATGSWASPLGYSLQQLGIAGGYADIFDDVPGPREVMFALTGAPYRGDAVNWLGNVSFTLRGIGTQSLFPSVHLRTNVFMIERDVLLSLEVRRMRTKRATYRLESGRGSLTAQLTALGRPPVVVDRHGNARHAAEWHAANVFWQSRQEDLLVADNQTRQYDAGPPARRNMLSRYAWGLQARPWIGD